jgi:hypothetical protein
MATRRAHAIALRIGAVALLTSTLPSMSSPQSPARAGINYDESRVVPYTLPDPLVRADGRPVRTAEEWRRDRRPELLALFEREVYGKVPPAPAGQWFETRSVDQHALGGHATRKEVRVHFERGHDEPYMDVLLYVPNARRAAAPVPTRRTRSRMASAPTSSRRVRPSRATTSGARSRRGGGD